MAGMVKDSVVRVRWRDRAGGWHRVAESDLSANLYGVRVAVTVKIHLADRSV